MKRAVAGGGVEVQPGAAKPLAGDGEAKRPVAEPTTSRRPPTRYERSHTRKVNLCIIQVTQNKYYVGEKKGPGDTTCFDTGNTV